jgi:hypothetical protein
VPVTVSGKTFELRDRLKSLGGRWNADTKAWEFSSLSPAQRSELKAHVGVVIGEQSEARPEPITFDFDDDDNDVDLNDFGKGRSRSVAPGRTNIHGDDPTWFNYFRDQNPIGFFGFSSLSAMVKYLERLPEHDRNGQGWIRGDEKWSGTDCMGDAIDIARKGWDDGVELAQEIHETLTGQHAKERRRKHTVAGGSVNVGRMLAGNPAHMIARPKREGKKVVTFFVEGFMSAGIDADNAVIRAALIGAITDVLEMNGYSCEIVSIATAVTVRRNDPAYQVATTLKAAGETLNLNDVVFALGHPSYFRRLVFGCVGSEHALEREWSGMGLPSRAFDTDHAPRANELFIDKIALGHQRKIDDDAPLITRAMQIWDLIADGKLPVTLNREDAA